MATQKFIADIAQDAYQYSKIRAAGNNAPGTSVPMQPRGRYAKDRGRAVLTMDDLGSLHTRLLTNKTNHHTRFCSTRVRHKSQETRFHAVVVILEYSVLGMLVLHAKRTAHNTIVIKIALVKTPEVPSTYTFCTVRQAQANQVPE